MRKALLSGLVLAAAFAANSVSAADLSLPAYKALPPVVPLANWTGCYAGGQLGGIGDISNFGGQAWGSGFLGGGTLGCNYQIDHFVVGVEGEVFWSTLQVNLNATGTGFGVPFGTTNSTKNPWTSDLAVRLGLAYDRFFIYDKTGATFGRFQFATTTLGAPSTFTNGSATIPGVIQGIGLEYMITPWLSAKAEFDLLVYSSQNVNFSCTPTAACGFPITTSSQPQLEGVGKIGLNYKFW